MMRAQDDIARDLQFGQLTTADEEALAAAEDANRSEAERELRRHRARERMGWVFSAFVWGYALFEIPGGWLGDVRGPRAIISRIVIWWSVFTAVTGSVDWIASWFVSAPGPTLLVALMVVARFLFGAGEAGAYPNITRALAHWFPSSQWGSVMGTIWLSSRLGGALAPVIVGALMSTMGGWRQAFWVLGGVGIVWAVLFYRWFRDRPMQMTSVNQAEVALVRGVPIEGSIDEERPIGAVAWRLMIASTNLWAVCLASASVSFCWYFNVTFLPAFLKDRFSLDLSESEVMSGLPLLVGGVACLVGGRLSDSLVRRTGNRRWGRSILGIAGMCGAALCSLCVAKLPTAGSVVFAICVGVWLQDLAVPCLWTVVAEIGGQHAGTTSGIMNACGAIGGAMSPLVVPRIVAAYGWSGVFVLFSIVYFVGAAAWVWIDATKTLTPGAPQTWRLDLQQDANF